MDEIKNHSFPSGKKFYIIKTGFLYRTDAKKKKIDLSPRRKCKKKALQMIGINFFPPSKKDEKFRREEKK